MSLNPFLWFFASFLLLVVVQKWIHRHLHGIAFLLTGEQDIALVLYALPLLPGVAVHEISHAVMATLLSVKSANLTIVPRRQADGHVRLGSVQVERVDPIRSSLIGLAPLIFGSALILLISQVAFGVTTLGDAVRADNIAGVLASLGGMLRAPDAWVWLYLLFAVANAMVPSPADRETWLSVILFSLLILAIALVLGLNSAVLGFGALVAAGVRWLAAAFTITLVVDAPFIVIIWLAEQVSGRVVGRRVAYTSPPPPKTAGRSKKP